MTINSCVLTSKSFKARTAAVMEGRYAAEKEAEVIGDGGGGSRSTEGGILVILESSYNFLGTGSHINNVTKNLTTFLLCEPENSKVDTIDIMYRTILYVCDVCKAVNCVSVDFKSEGYVPGFDELCYNSIFHVIVVVQFMAGTSKPKLPLLLPTTQTSS